MKVVLPPIVETKVLAPMTSKLTENPHQIEERKEEILNHVPTSSTKLTKYRGYAEKSIELMVS